MKKDVMEKWVAALRSGKYRQGKNRLRNSCNQFCCLGVLCDISEISQFDEDGFYLKAGAILPYKVMEWADIKSPSPYAQEYSLMSMNDSLNKSFEEIADFIEANYEEL